MAIRYLAQLAKLQNLGLEIIHVEVFEEKGSLEIQRKQEFLALLDDLGYPELQSTEVTGKRVVSRLMTYCSEKNVDLLGLVHHQDSLLVRMVRQSTTANLLEEQTIPLIVFPSKMF